jgi:hypothetical protein
MLIFFDHSFGELALLLPNMEIDMVVFGASAYKLSQNAEPSSIAAREYAYEFRAPEQCGSGSIRIQLHKDSAIWDPIDIVSRKMIPDVVIGLNTGISSFKTWWPVYSASRALSIPFAVTEYSRMFLAQDGCNARNIASETVADGRLCELIGHEKIHVLVESVLRPPPSSAMNPFMRPGHTGDGKTNRMPYAVNGFTCIVTPRPNAEELFPH